MSKIEPKGRRNATPLARLERMLHRRMAWADGAVSPFAVKAHRLAKTPSREEARGRRPVGVLLPLHRV